MSCYPGRLHHIWEHDVVQVSLKTEEDLIAPLEKPAEGLETVNIGPKGSPHYVKPPVRGYQSMTAIGTLSVWRSKLTLAYNTDCTIFNTRLEEVAAFHGSGELDRTRQWSGIPELRDSPLKWKTLMELSCWHGKLFEENKSMCAVKMAGVKAFLFQASDLRNVVQHSGSNSWQQKIFQGDVIEWAGKKEALKSYLKAMHLRVVLPTILDPNYTPWIQAERLEPRVMSIEQFEAAKYQKRTRQQAGLGSAGGSASAGGSDLMREDSVGLATRVQLVPGPQALEEARVASDTMAKQRPLPTVPHMPDLGAPLMLPQSKAPTDPRLASTSPSLGQPPHIAQRPPAAAMSLGALGAAAATMEAGDIGQGNIGQQYGAQQQAPTQALAEERIPELVRTQQVAFKSALAPPPKPPQVPVPPPVPMQRDIRELAREQQREDHAQYWKTQRQSDYKRGDWQDSGAQGSSWTARPSPSPQRSPGDWG